MITGLVLKNRERIEKHVAFRNTETEVMRNVKGNLLYNTQLVLKNQWRIARGSFFAKIQNPQVEAGA